MRRRKPGALKAYSKKCPSCQRSLPANVHKCGFCGASPWYWHEDRIIWATVMAVIVVSVVIYGIFFR